MHEWMNALAMEIDESSSSKYRISLFSLALLVTL